MALSVAVGSITSPAGTGNQGYTGTGFQPVAILFWGVATNIADNTYADSFNQCFGAATSSTQRWAFACACQDNAPSANTDSIYLTNACLAATNASASGVIFAADFVSFDSDGFTLNWTTTAASGRRFGYMAFGGSDVTAAKAGTFTLPTSGATTAVTDPGFLPTGLFIAHAQNNTAGTGLSDSFLGVGFTDGTRQTALCVTSDDGPTNMIAKRREVSTRVTIGHNANTAAVDWESSIASFDANGFTLNNDDAPTATIPHGYLAIAGPQFFVGVETQKTSTGTKATTGVGFQPVGLMIAGVGNTASASVVAENYLSIGASNGTNTHGTWAHDVDTATTSRTAHGWSSSNMIVMAAAAVTGTASTTLALASVNSLDADGYTLNWGTADATAREFTYIAIGENTGGNVFNKAGHGVCGLVGAGESASEFVEAGWGAVGTAGAGAKEFIGAVVYVKTGVGVVGLVGAGAKSFIPSTGATYTKTGFGKVGTTTAGGSTLHEDVVPLGVSIAFGASSLDPYPPWTRIDPERG